MKNKLAIGLVTVFSISGFSATTFADDIDLFEEETAVEEAAEDLADGTEEAAEEVSEGAEEVADSSEDASEGMVEHAEDAADSINDTVDELTE